MKSAYAKKVEKVCKKLIALLFKASCSEFLKNSIILSELFFVIAEMYLVYWISVDYSFSARNIISKERSIGGTIALGKKALKRLFWRRTTQWAEMLIK